MKKKAGEKITLKLENSARFRHFDWDKVKTFYYVAKLGSITNTAEFLHMSQPALSRQIMGMEKILGCPLFTRQSRGLKLTRKGEELFSYAENTFLGFIEFTRNTHAKIAKGCKRKIRISATHAVAAYILDSLLFAYTKDHPHLTFELITDDYLIDIVLNDVDIAIRPYDSHVKGVQQEYLFTLEKKLYASPEYLQKYGEPKTVDELKNHCIIAPANPEEYPYSDLIWILKLGLPEGKYHTPVFSSTSIECLVKAAINNMGIIGSYDEMEIIKNSGLKKILPHVTDKKVKDYFIYPDYLEKGDI